MSTLASVSIGRVGGWARRAAGMSTELRRDRIALLAAGVMATYVLVAILAPVFAPQDPNAQNIVQRLRPPFWVPGGSFANLLGTDSLGRDMLSRVIFGTRASLLIGFLVVVIAGSCGTLLGVIAGYRGGRTDQIISRITDVQTAFPGLLLALAILAVVGPGEANLIAVFAINGWMVYARTTRSQTLSVREQPFIEAAESIGCPQRTIIFRHILPNLASTLVTLGTLELARIVLAESILSYLGVGVQPPDVSWGLMIADGQTYMTTSSWLILVPGIALAVLVLAVNVLAGWVRTVADPVQRSRESFARE